MLLRNSDQLSLAVHYRRPRFQTRIQVDVMHHLTCLALFCKKSCRIVELRKYRHTRSPSDTLHKRQYSRQEVFFSDQPQHGRKHFQD